MVRSSMMEVVINQHRIFLIKIFRMKVLNIYIYEGSENPLLITRVYSTKWLCSYDMLFYPFDTQVETDSIQTVLLLIMASIISCQFNMLLSSCRVAQ